MKKFFWSRYGLALLLVTALFGYHDRLFTAAGESGEPKVVLMRLEDIGPGGQYESPEQLGKLRTVLEYLSRNDVRYQIGVIPRWLNFLPDQSVYDVSLDRQDIPYVHSFTNVLKNAERSGAVIGMHGYTHQIGQTRRDDGNHESGIGNEFDVSGMPETSLPAFAEERLQAGIRIMQAAGITPRFWEAPHYHSAAAQDDIFRSFFGIVYENVRSKPSQQNVFYSNVRNKGAGAETLRSVYVPTPFSYIPYNKDDKLILNQLGKGKRVASFFYHPFLEFSHLQPVLDSDGNSVLRDGLPEFTYASSGKSILQKLIAGIRDKGYTFYSLLDYVPFTPAQSVRLDANETFVQLGDADGDGVTDIVTRDSAKGGGFSVIRGSYRGLRNDRQQAGEKWLDAGFDAGDKAAMFDYNNDGKSDLWLLRASGTIEAYRSNGTAFVLERVWKTAAPLDWQNVYPLRQADGSWVIAGTSKEKSELQGFYLTGGELKPTVPMKVRSVTDKRWLISKADGAGGAEHLWIPKLSSNSCIDLQFDPAALMWKASRFRLDAPEADGELRLGDFNGDGKEDLLFWNSAEMTATVMIKGQDGKYRKTSRFGPWGEPGAGLIVRDFDGNGKSDLGSLVVKNGGLDVALSYQTKELQ